ncbi:unnamed protein product, partial [marine sediment metagenome]
MLWDVKGIKELQAEIYEEDIGGLHYLPTITSDPIHLISSRPIETYEDLKGLKISGDATLAFPFEEAGAVSILIPPEELYLAGTTGIVDAILWCGAKEATTSSWNEPFPYFLTNAVNGGATQEWVVNLEMWDSLPSDMQEILTLSWEALAKRQLVYYYEGECASRKNFTLTTMPEEDWA